MSFMIKENIYGHLKRLNWIISHIRKDETIIEFGCGTGFMICMQLAKNGYNILGIDLDHKSIDYGKEIFTQEGLNPDILISADISEFDMYADVIIASEVLEHIDSENLDVVLTLLRDRLKPKGLLLVTVPNGYGWFEIESHLWNKFHLGFFFEKMRLTLLIKVIKQGIFGKYVDAAHPSTLATSPHVQRFTLDSIISWLRNNKFQIIDTKGSVMFCGPFSNLFFTGMKPIMKFNNWLGDRFPTIASGFYIAARKID